MLRPSIRVPEFLFFFLLFAVLWHVASTALVNLIFTGPVGEFSLRVANKKLHYALFLGLFTFPPILLFLSKKLSRVSRGHWVLWFLIPLGVFVNLGIGSWVWFLIFLIVLLGLSYAKFFSMPIIPKPLGVFVLFLLTISIFFSFHHQESFMVFDLYDHGPALSAVNDFMMGKMPYRDIFIHYGVLRDIVRPLVSFEIWGTTYAGFQELRPWLAGTGGVLFFLLLLTILKRRWWIIIMGLILIWRTNLFMPERAVPSILTGFLLCLGLTRFRPSEFPKVKWNYGLVLGGVSAIGALLYSLETGLTLLAGIFSYLFIAKIVGHPKEFRILATNLLLGSSIAIGIFLIYLVVIGGLPNFIKDIFQIMSGRIDTWADGLQSHVFHYRFFKDKYSFVTFFYIHAAPIISILVLTYLLVNKSLRGISSRWHQALLLSLILFFQFFVFIGRSDYIHWKNSTIFLWPLLAMTVDEFLDWLEEPNKFGFIRLGHAVVIVSLLGVPILGYLCGGTSFWNFLTAGAQKWESIERVPNEEIGKDQMPVRLGNVPVDSKNLEEVQFVVKGVKNLVPKDGYFFDFTNYGAYYFLTERKNPTRFGLVNYIHSPAMLKECISDLDANPPQALLVEKEKGHLVYRKDLAPLGKYILKKFESRLEFGRLSLFVPIMDEFK